MGGTLAVLYGMCNCLFVGMYADDDCPDDSKLFIVSGMPLWISLTA